MDTGVLLFLSDGVTDEDLNFLNYNLIDLLNSKLSKINGIGPIFLSVPKSYKGTLSNHDNTFIRENEDDVDFWKEIFSKINCQHMIKVFADSPFIKFWY